MFTTITVPTSSPTMASEDRTTGVLEPLLYSKLKEDKDNHDVVGYFQRECQKPEFLTHCQSARQPNLSPSFQVNSHLNSGNECLRRFEAALQKLGGKARLQVAFHGTPPKNVSNILRDGLDPALRSSQCCGPGEYFSSDPFVAMGYCGYCPHLKEVVTMLVCAVVLPEIAAKNHIVVNNPNHHIPIGILQWEKIHTKMVKQWPAPTENQKQMMAYRSTNFHKRLQRYDGAERASRIKCQILLDLTKKHYLMASSLYTRFSSLLLGTPECAEILDQVLDFVSDGEFPEAVIAKKFPGLLESQLDNYDRKTVMTNGDGGEDEGTQ